MSELDEAVKNVLKLVYSFKQNKEILSANLAKKRSLCEQAEALKDSTDWNETTEKFVELQQQWKKVGPVARKYSDDLWKKFTAACDAFFDAKEAVLGLAKKIKNL